MSFLGTIKNEFDRRNKEGKKFLEEQEKNLHLQKKKWKL